MKNKVKLSREKRSYAVKYELLGKWPEFLQFSGGCFVSILMCSVEISACDKISFRKRNFAGRRLLVTPLIPCWGAFFWENPKTDL